MNSLQIFPFQVGVGESKRFFGLIVTDGVWVRIAGPCESIELFLRDIWNALKQYQLTDGRRPMLVTSPTGSYSYVVEHNNDLLVRQHGIDIQEDLLMLDPKEIEDISSKLSEWRGKST